MAMNVNRTIQLEKCFLKDAARFRALAGTGCSPLSIRAWRDKLANLAQKGSEVYFAVCEDIDLGYVLVTNPFELTVWNIVYLSDSLFSEMPAACEVSHDGTADRAEPPTSDMLAAREVSRQLFRMDHKLYRADVYYSKQRKRQERGDDTARTMECSDDLLLFTGELEHSVFFSPELDDRQVAFISWDFGYIAVITNNRRDKIESIEFVRGHIAEYDVFIRKAAYFNGLVDNEGSVIPNICLEPTDHEPDILVKARQELARYLHHAHEPEIEYDFPHGTPFQQSVWKEVTKIPLGSIKTYSDLALLVEPDRKKAGRLARAVGQALSVNPLPILIPCHRVIGANRNLVGFAGGVDIKEYLLQMELWKVGLED